jgi:hypothetical protein
MKTRDVAIIVFRLLAAWITISRADGARRPLGLVSPSIRWQLIAVAFQ